MSAPPSHELGPDTAYPLLHVGWHVEPDASELVQLPTPPFAGAAEASHVGSVTHVAAVSTFPAHELGPDATYPLLHVGWHVDPGASELVQSPTPPFAGAAEASQGSEIAHDQGLQSATQRHEKP